MQIFGLNINIKQFMEKEEKLREINFIRHVKKEKTV